MPQIVPASGFGRSFQQTAKAGVGLTAGGSAHTMGAYATLLDPLAFDCYGLFIKITTVSAATTDTRGLMDIAIGPTGGGNEQIVIPFLDVGAAGGANTSGKTYFFPIYVPAGKAIRARWQSVTASDTTIAVFCRAYGLPPHGFSQDMPQEWTQYGGNAAASRGVAVTSGSGSFGTEVEITAGTTGDHRWFHVGIDWGTNTTISAGRYSVRLSRDTAAADIIGIWEFSAPSTSEDINGPHESMPVCCPVANNSTLYVDVDGGAAEAMSAMVYAA